MLVVISPAKKLDWSSADTCLTRPDFAREAGILAGHARALTLSGLRELMGLSDDLARLNRDRFRAFQAGVPEPDSTRPAVFAFAGDTYQGLDVRSLDVDALRYAGDHLRILSGLYGVLRPMDAIQPYRLEMASRLKTRRGRDLYQFWRDIPTKALNRAAETSGSEILVNCASREYFSVLRREKLKPRVIEPRFFEEKNGQRRMVSFLAKKARGAMARFIVEHRIRDGAALRDFAAGGYCFDPVESDDDRMVFVRPQSAAAS